MENRLTKASPLAIETEDRIGRIRMMSDAIEKAAGGIIMVAMAIGDELHAEKAARPHGEFIPWLETNIDRMGLTSTRTAREYMKLATNREQIEQMPALTSLRAAFRVLGRGDDTKALAAPAGDADGPEPTEPITSAGTATTAPNPRSRRAFAIQHMPPDLRMTADQLARILAWYESDQLTNEYRAAHTVTTKAKPRKPVARVTATMKPKAKRELERHAKRNHMTHGELIERLMAFADQLQAQAANSKGGDRRK
ncbi:MAG: hypothetical protein FGM22_10335 [Burkholderiaceae bacterium]|nr:hypothetical protein [Burkholderiaceae bacterium]